MKRQVWSGPTFFREMKPAASSPPKPPDIYAAENRKKPTRTVLSATTAVSSKAALESGAHTPLHVDSTIHGGVRVPQGI